MTEVLSQELATRTINSFPNNYAARLGAFADLFTQETKKIKPAKMSEARPGVSRFEKDKIIKQLQRHISSLSHYDERVGHFQRNLERAISPENIGFAFSTQETRSSYQSVLSQIKKASDDAESAYRDAKTSYELILKEIMEKRRDVFPPSKKEEREKRKKSIPKVVPVVETKPVEKVRTTKDTVNSELKKWEIFLPDDLVKRSLLDSENLYTKTINEDNEDKKDNVIFGETEHTTDRVIETSSELSTYGLGKDYPEEEIKRGKYTLVIRLSDESYIYSFGIKKISEAYGNQFSRLVSPLFQRNLISFDGRKEIKYEMPDVDWMAIYKDKPPSPPKKGNNPFAWADGQVVHCISIRPYFGYSPVVVQLNVAFHFKGEDIPVRMEGVFYISYDKESGDSPDELIAQSSADEEGMWSHERDYWNVDYEDWGKTESKPGHSLNMIFYEYASLSIANTRKGNITKGYEVFKELTNYFENFSAKRYGDLPRWHHVPVQLSSSTIKTTSTEGGSAGFSLAFRKMRIKETGIAYGGRRDIKGKVLEKISLTGFTLMVSSERVGENREPLYKIIGSQEKINKSGLYTDETFRLFDIATNHAPSYLWLPFEKEIKGSDDIENRLSRFDKPLLTKDPEDITEDDLKLTEATTVGDLYEPLSGPQTIADIVSYNLKRSGAPEDEIIASQVNYPPSVSIVPKGKRKGPINARSCEK